VNEPIPDAYFDRKLSKGTTIRDWRYSSVDENGDPRFFATLRDGMASEIDEFYNEWFAEQEKKKKIKESQKDNPISALPVDIDTKIMENLPPIANKDKANNFFYHIVISLFFCIAIVVVILFSIRKKKNTK
jgi:hypothetical protein